MKTIIYQSLFSRVLALKGTGGKPILKQ